MLVVWVSLVQCALPRRGINFRPCEVVQNCGSRRHEALILIWNEPRHLGCFAALKKPRSNKCGLWNENFAVNYFVGAGVGAGGES